MLMLFTIINGDSSTLKIQINDENGNSTGRAIEVKEDERIQSLMGKLKDASLSLNYSTILTDIQILDGIKGSCFDYIRNSSNKIKSDHGTELCYKLLIKVLQYICSEINNQDILLHADDTTDNHDLIIEHNKQQFDKHRSKLLTLFSKNEIIGQRHRQKIYSFWLWFSLMIVMTIGLSIVYFTEIIQNENVKSMILMGISLIGLLSMIIMTMFVNKNTTMDHFTGDVTTDDVTTGDGTSGLSKCALSINYGDYLSTSTQGNEEQDFLDTAYNEHYKTLKSLLDVYTTYSSTSLEDKVGTELAYKNIVKDLENKIYLNMRNYQLIDYKIHDLSSQTDLICKGIMIVSIIGLLSSLQIKNIISRDLLSMLSLIMIILYSLLILLVKKNKKSRNKYNWNKMYWNIGDLKNACVADSSNGSKCQRGFSIFLD